LPEQIPDDRKRRDQQHGKYDAGADAVHSSSAPITGYTNATPSGSFSLNQASAASSLAKN
jgi:hypothetical protein